MKKETCSLCNKGLRYFNTVKIKNENQNNESLDIECYGNITKILKKGNPTIEQCKTILNQYKAYNKVLSNYLIHIKKYALHHSIEDLHLFTVNVVGEENTLSISKFNKERSCIDLDEHVVIIQHMMSIKFPLTSSNKEALVLTNDALKGEVWVHAINNMYKPISSLNSYVSELGKTI